MTKWCSLAAAACAVCIPGAVHAYSDPAQFDAPALEAGGGGRFYTGSAGDAYTCESCHTGGANARVAVSGIPTRYVPGATYTIRVDWPLSLEHAAVSFEVTDTRGRGAGSLQLPPLAERVDRELCEPSDHGVLAAAVYATERDRQIAAAGDCGAHSIRAQWTAPRTKAGAVWLTGAVLASNHDGELGGDGVTTFSERIPAFGEDMPDALEQGSCAVVSGVGVSDASGLGIVCALLALLVWRRGRARAICGLFALLVVSCASESPAQSRSDSVLIARGHAVERWDAGRAEPDAALTSDAAASDADAQAPDGSAATSDASTAHEPAGAPTRVVFRVTSLTQMGRYQPKNVGAIWVEDETGRGIKTLAVWASLRTRYLTEYIASNPVRDTADAITSATLRAHGSHEVTWNLRDSDNQIVPDGVYSLVVEVTDKDATGQTLSVMFRKGAEPQVITPPDSSYFSAIELRYE